MKKPPPKPRNRAAQEATLINLRALKKTVAQLRKDLMTLMDRVIALEDAAHPAQESGPLA